MKRKNKGQRWSRNGGITVRCIVLLWSITALIGMGSHWVSAYDTGGPVPEEALPHLLVGPDELPYDLILVSLDYQLPFGYTELWFGPPKPVPDTAKKLADTLVHIRVDMAGSPQEAVQAAETSLLDCSIPPKERTGEPPFDSFADRVWYGRNQRGGSVTFVIQNVMASVWVSNKNGFEEDHLFALAKRLSNKVQAAMEGRPYPIPYLPPSANDMKMELEDAWKLKNAGELFGKKSATIALQNGKAQPKSLPARQLGEKDYLVTLSHVAGILGMKEKPKVGDDTASFKIAGKQVTVTRGKSEVKVDKETVQLSRPAEFMGGQVLVPLSFVEKAFGQPLVWEKKDKVQVARLKTKIGEG